MYFNMNACVYIVQKGEFISVIKRRVSGVVKSNFPVHSVLKLNLLVINLLIKGPLCNVMVFHSVCEMRNITFYESE